MMQSKRGFDVAVIGAGVIGLAVALQLKRAGVQDVLVVERNAAAGMGSTSRANGGVRAQFTTSINIEFSQFTIGQLSELDELSGGVVGLRRIGYLFLAGTEASVASLRRAGALQRSFGVAVEWMSPEEVADRMPYIDGQGLRGATFCATDGIIDPHGVVTALHREARRLGAAFQFDTAVEGIRRAGEGIALDTPGATIEADFAVNAAGPSARDVAALAGVEIPVAPYRRNLVCTEAVSSPSGHVPMCVDMDTGVLIRREQEGFLIGYSSPDEPPGTDTQFDSRFLEDVARRIGNRFSFLDGVPINPRKCWAGLYPETVDHHAIVDAHAALPRFIQCVGFGGHGIMHSLAAGQAVAELVHDGGSSTFDLGPLRLQRFHERGTTVETAVL